MPSINWTIFEQLPGSTEHNFEMLCRALIRRHYGKHGNFVARAQQPGIEFHIRLHTNCSLGEPERWYGWQCRWYDLPNGRALGVARRRKIEEAIRTTEKELPGLTDWVLWTRRSLTAGDQKWFYNIKTEMRLALWTAEDVEEHLNGDGLIFRNTYFGELTLTPEALADLHQRAASPIRRRWQPEVHQVTPAEREIRRMTGDVGSWADLKELITQLQVDIEELIKDNDETIDRFRDLTVALIQQARDVVSVLIDCHDALAKGDLDLLNQLLANRPAPPNLELTTLPRRLRANRRRAALTCTNTLADMRLAYKMLTDVDECLHTRLIALVAGAGYGKTQFAAQFSLPSSERPAGILLYGGSLQAGQGLDDLAHRVVIHGNPVASMEALIAAVDAAGQRAKHRIPIVIDALNESEDPRDWKDELASLAVLLERYPYVMVVCTVRTAFVAEALPPVIKKLEIPSFGHDTVEAVRQYFAFYRIRIADPTELPLKLLSHPLTLRLFCEVTNPNRDQEVGIEAIPRSLTALFDRYLQQASERISELAPRNHRYYEQDIRAALEEIGIFLWEQNARSLDLAALRVRIGDTHRPWNESMIYALEQDGVLIRNPGDTPGTPRVAVVYDALAGHIIADSLLTQKGFLGLADWLKLAATNTKLAGKIPDQHTLAFDVLKALVGLVPRRLRSQQLWTLVDRSLRDLALQGTAELEGAYLDAATVTELGKLILVRPAPGVRDLFHQLWQTRASMAHPLNAEFLDSVLRPLPVSDRDLRWTEWIRHNLAELLGDLQQWETRWRDRQERSAADALRARWIMWTLTSTVRELRDQATRTLYWFGRGDAAALFKLTLESLSINDDYIQERMLSASYGIVMAHQQPDLDFAGAFSNYLVGLRDLLTGANAAHPTSHWLARLYVQGTITLAYTYYPDAIPEGLARRGRVLFATGPTVEPITDQDPRKLEVEQTLRLDFRNYTLGRLIKGRRNYDMSHPGHQAAVAHVRGGVWQLGWRQEKFSDIDKNLLGDYSRRNRTHVERYGKKYGWIGFYIYAGILADKGELPRTERLSAVNIDPSFPEPPLHLPIQRPLHSHSVLKDDKLWIRKGTITIPDELLYSPSLGGYDGPWIAVYGYITEPQAGRQVIGYLTGMLVNDTDAKRLLKALADKNQNRRELPEAPEDYYVFAGEIPWSPEFARTDSSSEAEELYGSKIEVSANSSVNIEILASRYSWESHHSVTNQAGGSLVPSRLFSIHFDLRGLPQVFHQSLPDKSLAALSFRAPTGFDGRLLYLREDLVYKYAAGRRLIWHISGEREIQPFPDPTPDWIIESYRNGDNLWQYLRQDKELSPLFKKRLSRRKTYRSSE